MAIGIIGAMEEEITYFLEALGEYKSYTFADRIFYQGELCNHEVIVALSGIGKVNAAVTTTLLFTHFDITHVFNTGSAGGADKHLNVGDIILATECFYHDVDVRAFGYQHGQVPHMPVAFENDSQLLNLATKALENSHLAFVAGTVATGDSFIGELTQIEQIKQAFPNTAAVEMEACSVAQVCYQFNVPFLVIRSISDIAGKESHISFKDYLDQAARNATLMLKETLRLL